MMAAMLEGVRAQITEKIGSIRDPGRGLWGKNSRVIIRRLRGEWSR
jgi:hypothetical protein